MFLVFTLRKHFQAKVIDKKWIRFGLLGLLFLAIIHLFFLDTVVRSFALIRHSFFIVPLFYLLIAYMFFSLSSRKMRAVVIGLISLFNIFTLLFYYTETTKAPWDEAVDFLQQEAAPGTILLFDRSGSNVELFNYYNKIPFRQVNLTWEENRKLQQIDEKRLFTALDGETQFWLISSRNIKTGDYYKQLLQQRYALKRSEKYKEMQLYLFEVTIFK